MVAGIDVAIALHDGCVTALFGIDADAWFRAHPSGEGGIEELHKDFAYIVAHPFVEDGTHEVSPLFGPDAEGSDGTVFVEELCQVSAVAMLLDAFHDGTYLQELAIQLIAEEVVEGHRVLGIEVVGGRHCVPLDMIFVEEANAVHHFLPRPPALNIATVGIVLFLCAVDADAHQPAFVVEELAFGGEQGAVGLNAVADAFASSVVVLQADGFLVEAERSEHRFTSMPGEEHIGHLLHLNIVADVLLPDPL